MMDLSPQHLTFESLMSQLMGTQIRNIDIGTVLLNMAILRTANSSQHQLSSQTGARSTGHSLRPQTRPKYFQTLIEYHP